MGKPWARYEVGFIDHDKFRALTGNAIALWLEGKNYCDEQHSDGLLPSNTVKTFRFFGKKSVLLLTTSAGEKPGAGHAYAPLWESHPIGFKMHDYLEHNDCRDEVLQRLQDAKDAAELRKEANKDRQRKFREERREKLEALRNARNAPVTRYVTHPVTVTVTQSNALSHTPTEAEVEAVSETDLKDPPPPALAPRAFAPTARSKRPIFSGNRLVVFEWMFDDVVKMLAPYAEDFGLDEWFNELDQRAVASGQILPKDDKGAWLQARTLEEAQRRGLPLAVVGRDAPEAKSKTRARLESATSEFLNGRAS
jgi:hypothetical protein